MKKLLSIVLCTFFCLSGTAETTGYAAAMIRSHGEEWSANKQWDYVSGLVAKTILMYCAQYPEDELSAEAYQWCKTYADKAINANGEFYSFTKGSLDNIASAKVLLDLYLKEKSDNPGGGERYRRAAEYLYQYLRNEYTRITLDDGKGGFIHKDSYPDQMWLDGLYMGAAYYAEYISIFAPDDKEAWSDIALQFTTIHSHTYDAGKSLNYHGWSANPQEANSFWANQSDAYKGCSKEFWGRGMGWYAAALVDVLEKMPREHPDYATLAGIFNQVAEGIRRWQDSESGVWYQLLQYDNTFKSKGGRSNYLEASASSMFTYALIKGIRLGLLNSTEVTPVAQKAYEGLLKTFITNNGSGIDINYICRSAGLGPSNKPERDGTADYYLDGSDVGVVPNEGKGIGSFIMASLEYEKLVNSTTTSALPVYSDLDSPVIIYDMQGHRCQTAPKGLYIEVRNGKATKKINR